MSTSSVGFGVAASICALLMCPAASWLFTRLNRTLPTLVGGAVGVGVGVNELFPLVAAGATLSVVDGAVEVVAAEHVVVPSNLRKKSA